MRTLDRYVIRSFLWSALLLFVAVMALRIVADLFFNMDEFVEGNEAFGELIRHIGRYYGYQSLMYFGELGGTIIVLAAAFTLARMNHTNELTAMLASGVSLHRVILPMVISAMLMGGLIILDRELLIPPNAANLVRDRDEAKELSEFPVNLTADGSGTVWWSPLYRPGTGTMRAPILTIRGAGGKRLASAVSGGTARPASFEGYHETVDGEHVTLSGWQMTATALSRSGAAPEPWENTPTVERIYTRIGPVQLLAAAKQRARKYDIAVPPDEKIPSVSGIPPVRDEHYGMIVTTRSPPEAEELALGPVVEDKPDRDGRLNRPMFIFKVDAGKGHPDTGRLLGVFHARSATWVPGESPNKSYWQLEEGRYFFTSDLSGDDLVLRQSSRWLDLMSTADLTRLLKVGRIPDYEAAVLAKHLRFAEPINNLVMLLLALPFILSRERNIRASATLSVLMVGSYFAFVHACHLVGLHPLLAAFLPIVLFGTVAAVMLDALKT